MTTKVESPDCSLTRSAVLFPRCFLPFTLPAKASGLTVFHHVVLSCSTIINLWDYINRIDMLATIREVAANILIKNARPFSSKKNFVLIRDSLFTHHAYSLLILGCPIFPWYQCWWSRWNFLSFTYSWCVELTVILIEWVFLYVGLAGVKY